MTREELEVDLACLENLNCQCKNCSKVYEADDELSKTDYGPAGGYYDTFGDRY